MEPFTPAPPAAPQTWYPPTPVPVAPRPPLPVNAVMSLLGMVIGILLFVGLVTYHAIFLIPPPPSGFQPPSNPAITAYVNTVRTLGWVSVVAMDLAVAMSVMIAWFIGAIKGEVAESTRRGVFTFASIFLAIWIVFSFFGYTIFRGLLFPFG